jgi:O-acetylhomoserine/O-acetylserine sulfhydrylase-like pyridoxal-dependent enzyme|tara:strand:- start:166 stop:582 length:417 start_codon:yes stop_codon:yes gene_type:complete
MAISQAMCTSFKAEILDEQHDLVADTIKIALYTSSASLGAGTTAYSTTNEISGSGYTAGGVALSSKTVDTSGTTAYFDSADPSWTSASFTANGALIYNDTNSDKAIAVLAFGGDFTVAGGTFQIVFPAAGTAAIIRID